jgi:hypothetical protein
MEFSQTKLEKELSVYFTRCETPAGVFWGRKEAKKSEWEQHLEKVPNLHLTGEELEPQGIGMDFTYKLLTPGIIEGFICIDNGTWCQSTVDHCERFIKWYKTPEEWAADPANALLLKDGLPKKYQYLMNAFAKKQIKK